MRLPDACGMVVPIDGGNVEESCLHGAYVQDVATGIGAYLTPKETL